MQATQIGVYPGIILKDAPSLDELALVGSAYLFVRLGCGIVRDHVRRSKGYVGVFPKLSAYQGC